MRLVWTSLLWIPLATATTSVPAPISIGSSQTWYAIPFTFVGSSTTANLLIRDGADGSWSSFPLRVGTPAQNVRVFISTAATNTWVIADPEGCQGFVPSGCADYRGQLFSTNESTSWLDNGPFGLHVEQSLGFTDGGEFGFDTGRLESVYRYPFHN